MSWIKRITQGNAYIIAVLAKIMTALAGLFFQVVLCRYIGAELKGRTAYIASVISILSYVLSLGLHQVYPSFRNKYEDREYCKNVFLSFAYTIVFSAILLSTLFCLYVKTISVDLAVAVFFAPLYSLSYISSTVFLVDSPNKRNISFAIISVIEIVYMIILCVFVERSFKIAISALVFGELVRCVFFTIRNKFCFSLKYITKKDVAFLLKNSFLLMIALLLNTLNYKVDVLMLKQYSSISFVEIGVYSVGIAIAEKELLIPDAFKEILLSRLSNGGTEDDVCRTMRMCFPISFFSGLGIIIVAYPLISLLFGSEYAGSFQITAISVLGVSFMTFMKMIDMYNTVKLYQKQTILLLLIAVLTNVICNFVLIPTNGIIGAAIGTIIGHVACSFAFILFFKHKTGKQIREMVFLQHSDFSEMHEAIKSRLKRR